MSWYTLASVAEIQNGLTARFLPDCFISDSDRPVLVVTVVEPADHLATLEALGRFRESFIADYSSTPTSFSAVTEEDWEESSVEGRSVELTFQPYTVDELVGIAKNFEALHQAERSSNFAKVRQLGDIEHFVLDLIARAEARKALSSRSVLAFESQIDVLNRVLHRLRNG